MSMDDLAVYLDVFGEPATLAGAALTAVVDQAAALEVDGLITLGPAASVRSSSAPAAAAGQAFVAAGSSYLVRQVLRMPPDGAFTRLVLARA